MTNPTPSNTPTPTTAGTTTLTTKTEAMTARTESFSLQPKQRWKPLTFSQARALSNLRG